MAIVHGSLAGHLTPQALSLELDKLSVAIRKTSGPPVVVLDCLAMTSYELSAREAFVAWNRRHAAAILGLAILTERRTWNLVISGMSLASRQVMKPFTTLEAAEAWARQLTLGARVGGPR